MPQVILSFDLSIAAAPSRLIICSIADFTTPYTGLYGVNSDSKVKVCTNEGACPNCDSFLHSLFIQLFRWFLGFVLVL